MVRIVTNKDKTILDTRNVKPVAKKAVRSAGVWVNHEIRHDAKEFARFWMLELVLLVVLNFDTASTVDKIAHTAKLIWPW